MQKRRPRIKHRNNLTRCSGTTQAGLSFVCFAHSADHMITTHHSAEVVEEFRWMTLLLGRKLYRAVGVHINRFASHPLIFANISQ